MAHGRAVARVDDMAAACLHLMDLEPQVYEAHTEPMMSHINVGTGVDCTIRELAETMQRVVGFEGTLGFDTTKPDGTPRKLMDSRRINEMGWQPQTTLEQGLKLAYHDFLNRYESENHENNIAAA